MTRTDTAVEAARAGAGVAAESYRTSITVETKSSKMDYVTEADTRAQERIIEEIRDEYPDATVVGEEGDELKTVPATGDAWVIDPIDGTSNFVHEIPLWTTTVGVVRDGDPIAGVTVAPALDTEYRADEDAVTRDGHDVSVSDTTDVDEYSVAPILRYGPERDDEFGALLSTLIREFGDLRRFGCAQATLAMVASGSLDAAVSAQPDPNPWDTVAGVYMVRRADGTVTDVHGDRWEPGCEGVVATNGRTHDAVLDAVQSTVS